jgi:hypothetical protein
VTESLRDLAVRHSVGDPQTKLVAPGIYELYDSYFAGLREQPVVLLELGVARGESLKTFGTYFKHGTIIGIDIEDRGIDLSSYPNVRFETCDQRDAARLSVVCATHAPDGLDIIIDDASHYGTWSLMSYTALFPFLKPGGLYMIEDWATGYWTDWYDGGEFSQFAPSEQHDIVEKRIPTHDFGMVGFVKYLVDEVMSSGIRPSISAPLTRPNRLEMMHVHKSIVVLRKAG